jgi:hypothetical protein
MIAATYTTIQQYSGTNSPTRSPPIIIPPPSTGPKQNPGPGIPMPIILY